MYEGVDDLYLQALRSSRKEAVLCQAWRDGAPVPGADDLRIEADSSSAITDTTAPGVRRQLDVQLAPVPGLLDRLAPDGTQLRVWSVLEAMGGVTRTVPMGVFEIDSASLGYGPGGGLMARGSDRWVKVQRAAFVLPQASDPYLTVPQQIANLLQGALGPTEPVTINTGVDARVGSVLWEDRRDEAIQDLAEAAGLWVSFDRNGAAVIDSLPTDDAYIPAAWTVDASASGVLLTASRTVDRAKTRNVVVVNTTQADGSPLFPPQIVWDDNPGSPTYAGTDPRTGEGAGPFGIVTHRYSSSLLGTPAQAILAGLTILNRVRGLSKQLSLTASRNPTLDAGDAIDVLLPRERPDLPRVVERHIVNRITHPLTPGGVQSIETRSTRVDEV